MITRTNIKEFQNKIKECSQVFNVEERYDGEWEVTDTYNSREAADLHINFHKEKHPTRKLRVSPVNIQTLEISKMKWT